MSALTGIGSIADTVADDPIVAAAQDAVRTTSLLVPRIARDHLETAADLVASLAVMECCAAEAILEHGRVRRKLLAIARGKAARARCALEIAAGWGALEVADTADARAALDAAEDALAPPPRLLLADLLRR